MAYSLKTIIKSDQSTRCIVRNITPLCRASGTWNRMSGWERLHTLCIIYRVESECQR